MELTTEKKKELRGNLLQFLYTIYPHPISREAVYETFFEYWETDDILKALQYLVDKGYIEESRLGSPFGSVFARIHNYKLTSKGQDLYDQTTEDNGVYVRR